MAFGTTLPWPPQWCQKLAHDLWELNCFWNRSRFQSLKLQIRLQQMKEYMLVSSRLFSGFKINIYKDGAWLWSRKKRRIYIYIYTHFWSLELRIFGSQWGDQHHPGETTTLWSFNGKCVNMPAELWWWCDFWFVGMTSADSYLFIDIDKF